MTENKISDTDVSLALKIQSYLNTITILKATIFTTHHADDKISKVPALKYTPLKQNPPLSLPFQIGAKRFHFKIEIITYFCKKAIDCVQELQSIIHFVLKYILICVAKLCC